MIILVFLILSGCGFQLEGSRALPISLAKTYLDTNKPYTEFYESLTGILGVRGAEVVKAQQEAVAILRILEDTSGQRILSVSARNTPQEYEIFYAVTFSLESKGSTLIENETVIVTRSYSYDATQVLGKSIQEQILRESLAQDLARQIIRLIEANLPISSMVQS